MKRILVICSKYSSDNNNPYLTNDLVNKLAEKNYDVTLLSYSDKSVIRNRGKIEEILINIPSSIKILKYFFIWPSLFINMLSIVIKKEKYDQVIVTTTLSVKWPCIVLLPLIKSPKKTFIIFDIYPIHQIKIKSLPRFLTKTLWFFEVLLIKNFNSILTMGKNNQQYVRDYYKLTASKPSIDSLNLWGNCAINIKAKKVDPTNISFVFGGQIIRGRRLDKAIFFLDLIRQSGINITLDIYSEELTFESLQKLVANNSWIHFHKSIPRKEYLRTISKYDVGLIVTDEKADLPTFPSKIIDYAAAGIAAFCIVEKESELYNIAGNTNRIYLNSFDFSKDEIIRAKTFFLELNNRLASEAESFNNLFSLDLAINKITN